MVLEDLLGAEKAERHPIDMVLWGFVVSTISLFIAFLMSKWLPTYIFPGHINAWFLFLTSLALVQLLNRVLMREEKEMLVDKGTLLGRHTDVIFLYMFMFFGMIIAVSFWFTVLPYHLVQVLFSDQITEVLRIQSLRTTIVGSLIGTSGMAVTAMFANKGTMLKLIMLNNLRLLFLFMAFAFVFGAGAILLLTWNAAVVGVAIGNLIRGMVGATASIFLKTATYFTGFPISFFSFFVHGIFEVLGYFVGAIAGGIFSASIVRRHYRTKHFTRVIMDVGLLLGLAIALIIFGSYIEVYVTPLL
ncbi:MAG: stage II sporulation protein M [archaeon]